MDEKYLTFEQNLCAARIFLNTFGLVLEDGKDIDEYSKFKLFDQTRTKVGELYFDSSKVVMSANYNNSVLKASFDLVKMFGFVDIEMDNALYGQWSSQIDFELRKENNVKLSGEFFIVNSVDSEFGVTCNCHPFIHCEVPEKGNLSLEILRKGAPFCLEIVSGENYEVIDIRPWDRLNGYLLHDIRYGKYDHEKKSYPYRRYAGIFKAAERGENEDKLHVFLSEEKYKKQLDFRNEFPPKVCDDDSKEAVIQKGLLMQQIDPLMYQRIEELRRIFLIGDVSLFDNLISVCYDTYDDEELSALLGVKRQQMNYQDGADSLVHSYYGIGKSCFFPLEVQQRLLKK